MDSTEGRGGGGGSAMVNGGDGSARPFARESRESIPRRAE